jgi:hypothetical protein
LQISTILLQISIIQPYTELTKYYQIIPLLRTKRTQLTAISKSIPNWIYNSFEDLVFKCVDETWNTENNCRICERYNNVVGGQNVECATSYNTDMQVVTGYKYEI